jgi:hypothetical protein
MFRYLWHVLYGTFFCADKRCSYFRGLRIMSCRMFSSQFLSRTLPCVRHSQTIFQEHVVPFHNVPMWRDVVTYWRRKARWVLVTIENFTYHTTHCARCCGVTAMFVSHALAPPRGHAARPSVNPPFSLHGHPSRSYSNKLLRDTYINFLYTTVYFSDASNGSHCTIFITLHNQKIFSFYFVGLQELSCTFNAMLSLSEKSCFTENLKRYFQSLDYIKRNKTTPTRQCTDTKSHRNHFSILW